MAIAKGAGMIEPNMATMLAYILTDLDVPKATLDAVLKVRRALFLLILPASLCSVVFTCRQCRGRTYISRRPTPFHPTTPLLFRYPVPFCGASCLVHRALCLVPACSAS